MFAFVAGMAVAAAVLSWALTGLVLRGFSGARHAALPNNRTMHAIPTPNVGGIAVVVTLFVLGALWLPPSRDVFVIATAMCGLALVSWLDHYRPIWPLVRLLAHGAAIFAAISLVPADFRVTPVEFQASVPLELERVLLGVIWLWMINLVNFADGIDGIAAAGAAMIAVGYIAVVLSPFDGGAVAATGNAGLAALLAGACVGFLIWNWHPARIFLGDVGSIPLGFLIGWLMLDLVQRGFWVSALILPAVFVADTTLTLMRRASRGEPLWKPHRSHAYQRAVQGGATPAEVVRRMGIVNALLICLAVLATTAPIPAALAAATVVVLLLMHWSEIAARGARAAESSLDAAVDVARE